MATPMDLAKNEAVDNNVVTDNVLNEQMKALEVPVENQQVVENVPVEEAAVEPKVETAEVKPEIETDVAPPPQKPISDAEILFAAEGPVEEPVGSPLTKEEFAEKREKEDEQKRLRDRTFLKGKRESRDNLQLDLIEVEGEPDVWLFTLLDENGNIADTTTIERDPAEDKKIDAIFRKTKADIDSRDLKTLGAMEGRPQTLARMLTQNALRRSAEAVGVAVGVYSIARSPATAGLYGAGLLTNMLTDPEAEVLWGIVTPGDAISVGESVVALDKFERWLYQGPLSNWISDDVGRLKPLVLEEADELLDRPPEGLAFHFVASNLAFETFLPSGAFISGFKVGAREGGEFMKRQVEVVKDLQKELADKGLKREPTAAEVAKRMESEVKKLAKTWQEQGKNKLYRFGKTFKMDQINNIKNNPKKYYSEFGLTDGAFILSSAGIGEISRFDVGTGANTTGAILTSIFSGSFYSTAIEGATRAVEAGTSLVDPVISKFTGLTDDMAKSQAIQELGVEGYNAAIKQEAQSIVGAGNDITNVALLDAEKAILSPRKGGLNLEGLVTWMRGETTLDDLNLPPRQKKAARDFMKNLDRLDPLTKLDVIKHAEKSVELTKKLRKMGISDPEQGFGLLFGLNTLRAIEPEMIMQGVARAGKEGFGFKQTLLQQVSLEDYYAQKVRYTKQLQSYYEELLAAKRKNLIGASQRGEVIRTEVDDHLREVQDMIRTLEKEQIQSAEQIRAMTSYNIEAAKRVSGNRKSQKAVEESIKVMKILDPENAGELQEQYRATWLREVDNDIKLMKQAKNVAKKGEYQREVIANSITGRINSVQKIKNDLYEEAGEAAVKEIVDGTELVRELNRTFSGIPTSEQFAGGVKGVISDIDDILAEPAKKYIANAAKNAGISENDFKKGIAEAIKQGDESLTTETVAEIVNSPTRLLMYLADAETEVGGLLSEIPAFKFSGQDLKNIELGLKSRINKGGEFVYGQSGKQRAQLQGILETVQGEIEILEKSGQIDMTKWNKANAENVKYHDMLATDIVSKTWGTRVRSVGPEENWKYKNPREKWVDMIIGKEDVSLAGKIYDEVDMIFGDSKEGKQFIEAFNDHMVTRVQDNFSKGVDIGKMEPNKITMYGRKAIKGLNLEDAGLGQVGDANYAKMNKTLDFIRRLEIKSKGKFNFDKAYKFEDRLTNAISKSEQALDSYKYAVDKTKVAKTQAEKLFDADEKQFKRLFETSYGNYEKMVENPEILLNYMQTGKLKNMKESFVKAGMDGEAFDRQVHVLFVEGFTNRFVHNTGQIDVRKGKIKNISTLSGQEVIDYLEKNEKVIKEFIPDLNMDAMRTLAEMTALRESGDVIERQGIESVTAGLTKLTVGSYVSRLYAVASNRTSLRYVGAEALVVQMKRDEVATLAALMMNPKAAEKIAEIVKSGKPMSHVIQSSEAAWLPTLIGEIQAIAERRSDRFLNYNQETETQEKTSSSLPADEAMATETAFLEKSLQEENRAYEQAYQAEQDAFARDMQNNIASR